MSELRDQVEALAAVREETLAALGGLTVTQLGKPVSWRGATMDVRFLLLQIADVDDERRSKLRRVLAGAGWRQSEAHAILADAAVMRGRMLGALAGLSDAQLDVTPAPGEWPLRTVIQHVLSTEQRYTVHSRYAAARPERSAAGGDGGPIRPPDGLLPPLIAGELATGTVIQVRHDLRAGLAAMLEAFADLDDARLALPTDWLGIQLELRFRLRRFAAHERQHLVQVVKTAGMIGAQPSEAQLILAEAEVARAQLLALTIGLPDEVAAHRPAGETHSPLELLDRAVAGERALVEQIHAALTSPESRVLSPE